MLIETDVILAHVKEEDWLKSEADIILKAASEGKIELIASCEVIHELYYVSARLGIDLEKFLGKIVALTNVENIK